MERRSFLKAMTSSLAVGATGCEHLVVPSTSEVDNAIQNGKPMGHALGLAPSKPPVLITPDRKLAYPKSMPPPKPHKLADRLNKTRNFKRTFEDDIFIDPKMIPILKSVNHKLWQVRKYLGYGHFNLLGFDDLVAFCQRSSMVAKLTHKELQFFDQIFHEDAKRYGFYGEKTITKMTATIGKDSVKIPRTGHYLYPGDAMKLYSKIRKEIGPSIILTSGIRSVVKQMHLFLTKAINEGGNLSKASRSLAPPGHSFHGIGDFDVGKVGLGYKNFTDAFAATEEYRRLINSGYIKIRYTKDNPFGVRYEPWHIKVTT